MGVNNVGAKLLQGAMQLVVRAAVESLSFSKVFHSRAAFIQHLLKVTSNSPPDRNDCHFISVPIQPFNEVNGDAFGPSRA